MKSLRQFISYASYYHKLINILQVTFDDLLQSGASYGTNSGSASVSLPPGAFTGNNANIQSVGIAFSIYSTPSLFPVTEMNERIGIASPVVGLLIPMINTSSLDNNVTITLPVQQVGL